MTVSVDWRGRRSALADCEPWPYYFELRAREVEVLRAFLGKRPGGRFLELGCGNAFHSYLLSDLFDELVATDLFDHSAESHTLGLEAAARLRRELEVTTLTLAAASAESLPFQDMCFDAVFSAYVLEHVPHRELALREMFRVLRPGGLALTLVPAMMERVYNLPVSYLLMARNILAGLKGGHDAASACWEPAERQTGRSRLARRARRFFSVRYPRFPFPNPHGAYRTSTEEFLAHRPGRWERLFREAGFRIERTFTTQLVPYPLGLAISPVAAARLAMAGMPLAQRFGGWPGIRSLGNSYALLAVRPG